MIETMIAAEESDNGGAPATYREALLGPEGKEWQKAFDAEVEDSPVDDPGKARMEKYPHRQVVAKRIDFMIDSQSAKSLAENPVYHGRSKHILAKRHYIRQRVSKGYIKLFDVRTESMGADMMTMAVRPSILAVNMNLIGMFKSG